MDRPAQLSAIGLLCLARLLPPGDKGEARDKIAKDLAPLIPSHANHLNSTLETLEAAGLIALVKKGKTEKLTITAEGRQLALKTLGLEELPPKTTWAKLKSPYLLAKALNVEDAPRVGKAPGLKAELLRAQYGLELDRKPTIKQATNALSGKLFGLGPDQPFTMDAIVSTLLHREGILLRAGQKPNLKAIQDALLRREAGEANAKNPLDLIVIKSVGARNNKPAELGDAAIRSWVANAEVDAVDAEIPFDLAAFARRVLEAARSSPSGWFGDAKVFISHVWKALDHDPAFHGMNQEAFKSRLIERIAPGCSNSAAATWWRRWTRRT